jgi:hypothetical protein
MAKKVAILATNLMEISMKVSIRTAYRIVKKTENPDSDPIFIPQYQEEGSEDWHTFKVYVGSGSHNPIYFYHLSKAVNYIDQQKDLEDTVVYYEDDTGEYSKNLPQGP